jgi:hypothetical protein
MTTIGVIIIYKIKKASQATKEVLTPTKTNFSMQGVTYEQN